LAAAASETCAPVPVPAGNYVLRVTSGILRGANLLLERRTSSGHWEPVHYSADGSEPAPVQVPVTPHSLATVHVPEETAMRLAVSRQGGPVWHVSAHLELAS
jgi:hypothetical protein